VGDQLAKLHHPVAQRTGVWGEPRDIALHEGLVDPLAKLFGAIHHLVGDIQIFGHLLDVCDVFFVVGFVWVKLEIDPLHIVAGVLEQLCGVAAIHPAAKSHHHLLCHILTSDLLE